MALTTRFAPAKAVAGAVALIAGLSLIAGCGSSNRSVSTSGSGSSVRSAKKGTVTLNIKWPERPVTVAGKLIPVAANVITVTLQRVVSGVVVTNVPACRDGFGDTPDDNADGA